MHFNRPGREAVAAGVISSIMLVLFGGLAARVFFLRDYSSLFVAISFLYIPTILTRIWRQPFDIPEGLWRVSLRPFLVLLAVVTLVFPAYSVGFSFWQKWTQGQTWCGTGERFLDWPDNVRGAAPDGGEAAGVSAYVDESGRWNVAVSSDHSGSVDVVASDGATVRGRGAQRRVEAGGVSYLVPAGGSVQVQFPDGAAEIEISGKGEVLVGGRETEALPFQSQRGVGWLLWFLLVQVLLVALPEEYFYRGYLQGRLQQVFGRRLVWLGGDVGPAVWITSAVFAVGHVLTVPSAFRLAVFFPSLLFGWLRDKTGTLWVPVVVHVGSNLILEILHRMHC